VFLSWKLPLALASTAILGSESCGTHHYIYSITIWTVICLGDRNWTFKLQRVMKKHDLRFSGHYYLAMETFENIQLAVVDTKMARLLIAEGKFMSMKMLQSIKNIVKHLFYVR
jgi:hypothetical protein